MTQHLFITFLFALAVTPCFAGDVDNGEQPAGKAKTIVFTEDLRLGGPDADDQFYWGGLSPSVSADAKGNMYLTDPGNVRVIKIDPSGKYVGEIGGKGEGPGEFLNVAEFVITQDGGAVAFDKAGGMGRLMWFDADMKHIRNSKRTDLNAILTQAQCSPSGKLFAGVFMSVNPGSAVVKLKQGLVNDQVEPVKILMEHDQPTPDATRFTDRSYWVDTLADAFKAELGKAAVFNFDREGRVYTAVSNQYQVTQWSPDMKRSLMEFKRRYKPIVADEVYRKNFVEARTETIRASLPQTLRNVISTTVIRQAMEKAGLPPAKRPIFGLIPMPEGLLVIHDVNGAWSKADLFDQKGVYIGATEMDQHGLLGPEGLPRMHFANGFAYTVETDADGEHYLVRYKYQITDAQ